MVRRLAPLALLALAGCADLGGSNFPVFRSVGWFAFLDASDIRRACQTGVPDRYRLVYNGTWGKQVRVYEVAGDGAGGGRLTTRIMFPEAPSEINLGDPLESFRGRRGEVRIAAADRAQLDRLLRENGFDAPTRRGLALHSDGYYWVVAACRDGRFHYNAWAWPSPDYAALTFPGWLLAHDATGVPITTPAPAEPRRPIDQRELNRTNSVFDLEVGDNGLALLPGF